MPRPWEQRQSSTCTKHTDIRTHTRGQPDSGKRGFDICVQLSGQKLTEEEKGSLLLLLPEFTAEGRTLCHPGNSQQRQCAAMRNPCLLEERW